MTRQELVNKAKALGIQGTSKMNMAQLQSAIEALNNNSNNVKEEILMEKEKVMLNGVEIEVEGDLDLDASIPMPSDNDIPADGFMEEGSDSNFVPFIPSGDSPASAPAPSANNAPNTSELLCPSCNGKISQGVINFCKKNYPGLAPVCMDCQKKLGYKKAEADEVNAPLCPNCGKKHITTIIKDFCEKHYPGKTPVCMQCQKDLKYVDVLKGVNTTSSKFGVCSNPKCGHQLTAVAAKFSAMYADKLQGKKYCFACAPKELVLEFNKSNRTNNAPATQNKAQQQQANAPVQSYDELTDIKCECHGKQLTRAEVYRCKRLWIKRPEFEGVYLCLSTIIDKGLIADCK